MNKFSAAKFVNIGASLHWYGELPEMGKWDDQTRDSAKKFGIRLSNSLEEIGCHIAADAAARFSHSVPDKFGIRPASELRPRADELKNTIFSEMNRQLFLWVPPERARYYEYPTDVKKWDETERAIEGPIAARFKNAANEIYSARRCYAVAQWTPCVFHLMRACEVGLKALYKTLNISRPRLSDSWGNLLRPMDEQLQKRPTDRYGEWAKQPDFFDHATNDVRAIKRVSRDTTMHIDANYDESGARKALDAVTSFFVCTSQRNLTRMARFILSLSFFHSSSDVACGSCAAYARSSTAVRAFESRHAGLKSRAL